MAENHFRSGDGSLRRKEYIPILQAGIIHQESVGSYCSRCKPSTDSIALDDWTKLFIRYNCNEASVIDGITRKLFNEANNILSLTSRIEKWYEFRKEVTQITKLGTSLYLGGSSVKTSFLSNINVEFSWLEQKETTLSSVYGNKTSASGSSVFILLFNTLSVSQLAIWCRLLSACDILKHDNQTKLLKLVASTLQTSRAASISADSLRAKYYSPNRASLAIVKEYLFHMMNLIRDMYVFSLGQRKK